MFPTAFLQGVVGQGWRNIKITKNCTKFDENPSKIDFWALLGTPVGATLEPLGKRLGHMFPKDWILEAPGTALGAQNGQLGSNLEAQDPPKSRPKPEKIDVKKKTRLWHQILKGSDVVSEGCLVLIL